MPKVQVEFRHPARDASLEEIESLIRDNGVHRAISQLTEDQIKFIVWWGLAEMERDMVRREQLAVERKASSSPAGYFLPPEERDRPPPPSAEHTQENVFEDVYNDPELLYPSPGKSQNHFFNNAKRKAFKAWVNRKTGSFSEWYSRAAVVAAANCRQDPDSFYGTSRFEADWYAGGVEAYYRDKSFARTLTLVRDCVDQAVKETTLRVTKELLATKFALGNGTRVTWGDATIEQHQLRIELLNKNSAANVEASARHHKAIQMIKGAKVKSLGKIKAVSNAKDR